MTDSKAFNLRQQIEGIRQQLNQTDFMVGTLWGVTNQVRSNNKPPIKSEITEFNFAQNEALKLIDEMKLKIESIEKEIKNLKMKEEE